MNDHIAENDSYANSCNTLLDIFRVFVLQDNERSTKHPTLISRQKKSGAIRT